MARIYVQSTKLKALNQRRAAARKQRMTDIAEEMANGCPTVKEASRRLCISQTEGDKCWQLIKQGFGHGGWQAA